MTHVLAVALHSALQAQHSRRLHPDGQVPLDAHLIAPHMLEWGARVGDLMTERVIRVLHDI